MTIQVPGPRYRMGSPFGDVLLSDGLFVARFVERLMSDGRHLANSPHRADAEVVATILDVCHNLGYWYTDPDTCPLDQLCFYVNTDVSARLGITAALADALRATGRDARADALHAG